MVDKRAVSFLDNFSRRRNLLNYYMGAGAGFRRGESLYTPKSDVFYYLDFDYFRKAGSIPKLVIIKHHTTAVVKRHSA